MMRSLSASVPRYPDDLSSIPRTNQAAWLDRPSTPLVLNEVFNRRKNLVTSDLHVLLVTAAARGFSGER